MRIIEARLFKELDPRGISTTTDDCNKALCELKTLMRRRNYTPLEAVKTIYMAEKFGFIVIGRQHNQTYGVGITKDGLRFASFTGLLNELAATVGNVPPVASLLVSVAAIVVSVVALGHAVK